MDGLEGARRRTQQEIARRAVIEMENNSRKACPTCRRGAVSIPLPTVDDLEAMIEIRDGFNNLRRSFSPEMEERFKRFDAVISYMHSMISPSV